MKDYFFKPPINKLSLNFLDQDLEMTYRTSYQEEVCFSWRWFPSVICLSNCLSFLTHFIAVDDKGREMSNVIYYLVLLLLKTVSFQFTSLVSCPESSPTFGLEMRFCNPPRYGNYFSPTFSPFQVNVLRLLAGQRTMLR